MLVSELNRSHLERGGFFSNAIKYKAMSKDEYKKYWYDHTCLLIVTSKGVLRSLQAPFRVRSVQPVGNIPVKSWVKVEEVLSAGQDQLVYRIAGTLYSYSYFEIIIRLE